MSASPSNDEAQPPKKRGCPSWQNSIPRGSACLACRTRKVKCTGERPVCAGCTKLRTQHGVDRDDQQFPCEYEDLPPGTKKTRVSRKMVQTLEDKVAELEAEIRRLPPPPPAGTSFGMDAPAIPAPFASPEYDYHRTTSSSSGSPPGANNYTSPSSGYSSATSYAPDKSPPCAELPPLIPSAHSPYLPSPLALKKIVVLYLNSGHPCTSLFSQKHFFHRLALPPRDVEYPHDALLHAMVALAVELHGESILEGQKIPQSGTQKTEAAHWHAARARDLAHQGAITCDRFFDTLQAVILMSRYAHRICRFQDIWQLTGLGARVAVALRLNKMPAYSRNCKYEYCAYTNAPIEIVRIPRDVSDVTDRRMAFWWCYAAERFATANTGWAMVIQDEDISTMLPSATRDRADQDEDWTSTSIKSTEFFISHPAHLVGGVQLFFKATVLLGRASIINMRSPRFSEGVKVSKTPEAVRRSDEFQLLERQISDYLISTSGFPADHPNDIYTPFITCLPYVARILAHEPLCSLSQGDRSMMLCMDAARRVEASIGQVGASGTATELLPFLTFCWTVAGRTLIRQLAIKQAWEDFQGIPELRALIDRLLKQIESFRSPNAKNAHTVLSNFYSTPSILLPRPPILAISPTASQAPPAPAPTYELSPQGVPITIPAEALSVSHGPSSQPIRPRQFYPGRNFPLPDNTPSSFTADRQAKVEAELRGEAQAKAQTDHARSTKAQTQYRQQHFDYQRQRQAQAQATPTQDYHPLQYSQPSHDSRQQYAYITDLGAAAPGHYSYSMQPTSQSIALMQAEQDPSRRWDGMQYPNILGRQMDARGGDGMTC